MSFERGLHATSICGAVGAAVAVAMLQGQEEAGIASAAGIAASMGAGLLEANRDLARHGLTGPPTVLEGGFGFLQAFCGDRAHPDAVVRGLGTDWELPRVVFKPYPCNHVTHAGVDAALRLRAQGSPPPTSQRSSWASPSPSCARSPSHPRPRHGRPPGTTRRSAAPTRSPRRCSAAASACPTRTSPTPPPVTPRRLALAALVRCVEDERCSASFPHAFPAVLRVTTRTGEELERVEVNRDGPGNPPVRRGAGEEVPRQRREVPPGGARGRARGPNARTS